MTAVMIGIDPHKGSHTAVAIGAAEEPLGDLRVRAGAGFALHRWGKHRPDAEHPGWDLITIAYSDPEWYAGYLAWFGSDVLVLGPPELREAVIRRLKGALT